MQENLVVIRGGGDIATGIAHRLYRSGFNVVILEARTPLVIRRKVAFAEAVFQEETTVEGVKAVKLHEVLRLWEVIKDRKVPVFVDEKCDILKFIQPDILIDAILAKKNIGTTRDMAPLTIGVGPGFCAGRDVDMVIETQRGHNLGKVILKGEAEKNTGVPGTIMGYAEERVLRAPAGGKIKNLLEIGDMVSLGDTISLIADKPLTATIPGVIRGLIKDGIFVEEGMKIGDIDPRGNKEYCYTISDKARAIAGGVLEAILYYKNLSAEEVAKC